MDSLQSEDTGVPPRRSPRIVAHLQELEKEKEKGKERRNQLRRDEYKEKQDAMTEHEKQVQAEKRRITYRNRKMKIAAATQLLPTIRAHDHEASTSRSNPSERNKKRPLQTDQPLEHHIKDRGRRVSFRNNNDQEAKRSRVAENVVQVEQRCIRQNAKRKSSTENENEQLREKGHASCSKRTRVENDQEAGTSSANGSVSAPHQQSLTHRRECVEPTQHGEPLHTKPRSVIRRQTMTVEQLVVERETNCLRQRSRRKNLTEEQKLIVRERDRIRKKPDKEKQNLPTTSNSAGERRAKSSFIQSCNPRNIDQVQCRNDQGAEASQKRKGQFIAPDQKRQRASTCVPGRDKSVSQDPRNPTVEYEIATLVSNLSRTGNQQLSALRQVGKPHHGEGSQSTQSPSRRSSRFIPQSLHREDIPIQPCSDTIPVGLKFARLRNSLLDASTSTSQIDTANEHVSNHSA